MEVRPRKISSKQTWNRSRDRTWSLSANSSKLKAESFVEKKLAVPSLPSKPISLPNLKLTVSDGAAVIAIAIK